jgi:hypothetical protein
LLIVLNKNNSFDEFDRLETAELFEQVINHIDSLEFVELIILEFGLILVFIEFGVLILFIFLLLRGEKIIPSLWFNIF